MKKLEAMPALQLMRKRQVRIGVLVINASNFENEDYANEVNESTSIGKIINEYISGDHLDIISVGMAFGGLVMENDDGTAQKSIDKSKFIDEMLEDFNKYSGMQEHEKLVAVC